MLTPKQEAFAQKYIELGNASEAYRQCYDAENMKPESVWVKACELLKNGNVAVRVAELQQEHQEKHRVTVQTITEELNEIALLAKADKQFSPAVTAITNKAKLHGLMIEKKELTGANGGPIETKDTNSLDAARRIAFLLSQANPTKES